MLPFFITMGNFALWEIFPVKKRFFVFFTVQRIWKMYFNAFYKMEFLNEKHSELKA